MEQITPEDFKPQIIMDHMQIIDEDGVKWGEFSFKALICKGLFPHVFINEQEFFHIPSVYESGMVHPGAPHLLQKMWVLDLNRDFERWKTDVLNPYFANLIYYKMKGYFANGFDSGIQGVIEQTANI